MKLTILEMPARWGAPAEALAEIDAALTKGAATEMVVLPEAAIHGYVSPEGESDLAPFAEDIDGPTARACAALAVKHGVHLVAPLVLREGEALYNAMVCFDPQGQVAFVYRKRHPWIPETWATAGAESHPLVEIAGVRVTIAICYDVHFVPREGATQLAAADVLLFPSAWVEDPDYRVERLQWLAKRFGVTIANANWAPGDVRMPGQGGSCVVDAEGRVVARVDAGRIDVEVTRR